MAFAGCNDTLLLLGLIIPTTGVPGSLLVRSISLPAKAPCERRWTIADEVEVKRITAVAVRGNSRSAALVLERPSLSTNERTDELYEVLPGAAPRLLLRASYIADLSSRPTDGSWTMRADLGEGVQLYELGAKGPIKLVVNPKPVMLGGNDGLIRDPKDKLRATGVISYEWAPDGQSLWYSRARLTSVARRAASADSGLIYDDEAMSGAGASDLRRATAYGGVELHVVKLPSGRDDLVAVAASDPQNFDTFRLSTGSIAWVDSRTIQYRLRQSGSGALTYSLLRLDVSNGRTNRSGPLSIDQLYDSVPTAAGLLTVDGARHLIELGFDGVQRKDYGLTAFRRIGGGLPFWRDRSGNRAIGAVSYPDRDGLSALSESTLTRRFAKLGDNLGPCAFSADLRFGLCQRESLTRAPELVSIDGRTADVRTIYRPNQDYDAIPPLRSVRVDWINRFGARSSGYITYPRDYRRGDPHPVLVVTHSADAKNRFADDEFQWEFPIQVFAERGWFVLSVNEPGTILPPPYLARGTAINVDRQQFSEGLNAVASMEAAVTDLARRETIDRSRVGIAGYSRGAEIAGLSISRSDFFKAASLGDDSWYSAGGFWSGSALARATYRNLFGGSPFDTEAYPNYLKFSVSARAGHVAGPILQQFTGAFAPGALELDQLLRDKAIPTELVIYPEESHILYDPRHRASAMTRNFDWFSYWLSGLRDFSANKSDQYTKWSILAAAMKSKSTANEP